MARIQAVYFDAVGTLLFPDPPAEEVYATVGRVHGIAVSVAEIRQRLRQAFAEQEEVDRQRGWRVDAAREVGRWRAIIQACLPAVDANQAEAVFQELFEHFAHSYAWRLTNEAGAVLGALQKRDLRCGIASNYDARLRLVVAGFPELASLQERLVISAEVGYRKPSRAFFAAVVCQANCPPSQVLYVGDDLVMDYQAARAAGLQAVWYQPQKENEAAFSPCSQLHSAEDESAAVQVLRISQLSQLLTVVGT